LIGCHELTIADSSPCVQLFMKRKMAMPRVIEKLPEMLELFFSVPA